MNLRAQRRAYLSAYPLVVSIATTAFIGGLAFLVFPQVLVEASIGKVLPDDFELLWAACYSLGGGLVLTGFWRVDARWEVAGLLTLAAMYLVNAYTIFVFRGVGTGMVSASIFTGLCVGMTLRAYVLRFEPVRPWRRS